jgi:hypothetical protein
MNRMTWSLAMALPSLLMGLALGQEAHQFSHTRHVVKEELTCSDCHAKTMNSTSLGRARVALTLKTCEKCHSDDTAFARPKPIAMDSVFRIANLGDSTLKFNHKAHLVAKVECASCHGKLPAVFDSTAAVPPAADLRTMKNCMECHVQKAQIACLTCHTKVEKPMNHLSAAWPQSQGHGLQSNLGNQDCSMCHEQGSITTCEECHAGNDARKVHGLNYRFSHGPDVRFHKLDCAVCHAPLDQFCADCHEGKGKAAR